MEYQGERIAHTALQIARFDPAPHNFPPPSVPVLPKTLQPLSHGGKTHHTIVNAENYCSFSRGRYALLEAYRLAGLSAGVTLLAPAYHCITMLDPAIALDANILLYPLHPDLSPDMSRLDDLVNVSPCPVRALLATHFFGMARDFSDLKSWCDARNIVLIEDCSHVLFTENYRSSGTGIFGKYVAASPYKFFPGEDGGLLYAREAGELNDIKMQRQGFMHELRGLKRLLQRGWNNEEKLESLESIEARLAAISASPLSPDTVQTRIYDRSSPLFQSSEIQKFALASSRYLAKRLFTDDIAQQRINNYLRWIEAMDGLPGCRALYRDWPETSTPYMFPLYIDDLAPRFFWLKKMGLPVWRWDEMAQSDCLVSQKYQYRLLHLPCHQSLSEKQMAWMFHVVRKVMQQPARSNF